MKQCLILCLMQALLSSNITGQSMFTKFAERSDIQWAAVLTNNFSFPGADMNFLLRQRLANKEIRAAIVDTPERLFSYNYVAPATIAKRIDLEFDATQSDSLFPLFDHRYFDNAAGKLVEVQQVFYLQKGKLKSVVNMVSPKFMVVTIAGTQLGVANAFTTAFNNHRCHNKKTKRQSIPLGRVSISAADFSVQKQLYGQTLLSALWRHLDTKNYDIIRLDSMSKIPVSAVNASLLKLSVPSYDAEGNLMQTINSPTLGPEGFSIAQIEQSWFYNKRKNLLFNIIHSIVLNYGETAVLKILPK
ncbi:MAG: hypothetical protein EOO06_01545 [Chitinophagaceae bacterium]|nr:MAG: hypothetical protein EOO06_01545 [Chitinophagaceae bacterium]